MDMYFVAVDVETANPNMASICQVGVAVFENGQHVDSWTTLVDPEDEFHPITSSIHGIDEEDVRGAPKWPEVWLKLHEMFHGNVVVCHGHFDRVATRQACEKYGLAEFQCTWLDTAKVARRTWDKDVLEYGYGMESIADYLGIEFLHHDAMEDARAAGIALCHACEHTGHSIEDWLAIVDRPIGRKPRDRTTPTRMQDSPVGHLFGEFVVFCDKMVTDHSEAMNVAALAGCNVRSSITKNTTILVVSDKAAVVKADFLKTEKQRKVEVLNASGRSIKIMSEKEFFGLAKPS